MFSSLDTRTSVHSFSISNIVMIMIMLCHKRGDSKRLPNLKKKKKEKKIYKTSQKWQVLYSITFILCSYLSTWKKTVTGMKGWGRESHRPNLDAQATAQSHNPLAGVSKNLTTTSLWTDPGNSETRRLSLCFQSQQKTYYFERSSRFIKWSRQYTETRELCHVNTSDASSP